MKVVDLNILLYAVNLDTPVHKAARKWWEAALNDEEPVGLPWVVLLGFIRISTNRKVFENPLPPEEAIARVDSWLSVPVVHILHESEEHWTILSRLLNEAGTAGNLTTDAHLAALAIANGAMLVSCDHDFARFSHLRWENPLA